VTPESTRYLKLLEHRFSLLGLLTQSLIQSRSDFIAMKLDAMERLTAEQERLCAQVRSVDAELARVQTGGGEDAGLSPRLAGLCWPGSRDGDVQQDNRIRAMLDRIRLAQEELARANHAHQAMLRRSKRTVQILMNFFSSFAPTYSSPMTARATYEERI